MPAVCPPTMSCVVSRAPARPSILADYLIAGEELRDLFCRSVRRVGAMHRVLTDRPCVRLADRALRGLARIGRAHHVTILCDGAFAFEHLHHDGAGRHELAKLAEERALTVHAIEGLGLLAR